MSTGRPDWRTINQDVQEIVRRLSIGETEFQIRTALRLNRNEWATRMRAMQRAAHDTETAWTKYSLSIDNHIRRLSMLHAIAMGLLDPTTGTFYVDDAGERITGPLNLAEAARFIRMIATLQRERLEVGQSFGVYTRAPEQHEHYFDDPTAGMFLDAGEDVGAFARNKLSHSESSNTGSADANDAKLSDNLIH